MRNLSIYSAGVAAISLALSAPAQADTIDFSQFAPNYTNVSALSGTTTGGVGFTIEGGADYQVRVQGVSWLGTFGDGEHLIFNTGSLPTVINFASAISSISDIGLQMDVYGAYTATLNAFDGLGNLLGSVSYAGTSSYTPDTQPGFFFAADGIRSITLSSSGTGEHAVGYAPSPLGAVPEPATWGMMLAGFCIAGTVMRRTRRQMVSFA